LPNSETLESASGRPSLVSENRDFLRELKTEAFEVVDALTMLQKLEQGEVALAESME